MEVRIFQWKKIPRKFEVRDRDFFTLSLSLKQMTDYSTFTVKLLVDETSRLTTWVNSDGHPFYDDNNNISIDTTIGPFVLDDFSGTCILNDKIILSHYPGYATVWKGDLEKSAELLQQWNSGLEKDGSEQRKIVDEFIVNKKNHEASVETVKRCSPTKSCKDLVIQKRRLKRLNVGKYKGADLQKIEILEEYIGELTLLSYKRRFQMAETIELLKRNIGSSLQPLLSLVTAEVLCDIVQHERNFKKMPISEEVFVIAKELLKMMKMK